MRLPDARSPPLTRAPEEGALRCGALSLPPLLRLDCGAARDGDDAGGANDELEPELVGGGLEAGGATERAGDAPRASALKSSRERQGLSVATRPSMRPSEREL
jgi:hypothetical protein